MRRRSVKSMQRFYNRLYPFYGIIEKSLDATFERIAAKCIATIPEVRRKSALEYACGTGLLTFKIAPYFNSVVARDLSQKMLASARRRTGTISANIQFLQGNLLEIDEAFETYDWVFVACGLHLFAPEQGTAILSRLLGVSREGVVIVDHIRRWNPVSALIEWIEGSHYDTFVKTNFREVAECIRARAFEEQLIGKCSVMIFRK